MSTIPTTQTRTAPLAGVALNRREAPSLLAKLAAIGAEIGYVLKLSAQSIRFSRESSKSTASRRPTSADRNVTWVDDPFFF